MEGGMKKFNCLGSVMVMLFAASITWAQTSLLNPAGFTSLDGYFNPGGNVTVNMSTNQMSVSGGSTYTGVVSGSTLVFTFDSVNVGSGITISFSGVTSLGNKFALLSKGTMNIAGTINAYGSLGLPGPGGGAGAFGARMINANGAGTGGGYGESAADNGCSGGGAFGGNGGIGNAQPHQALAYGDLATSLQAGSGGGHGYYADSGSAGGGGGAIELGARSATLTLQSTCRIYAYGANGFNSITSGWDGTGGGSGGGVLIHSYNVSIVSGAIVNANGGAGGNGNGGGWGAGGAGGGRVSIYYHSSGSGTNSGTVTVTGGAAGTGDVSYPATAGSPGVFVFNGSTSTALGGMPPAAPVAKAASGIGQTGYVANWDTSAGATGYYMDVATDSGFTAMVTGYNNLNVGNVKLDTVDTGINPGTVYYYRVRAYNGNGTSGNSNIISLITAPADPTATAATVVAEKSFTANWDSVTGAAKYYLDVASDSGFTAFVAGYQDLDAGSALTYDVSGLDYSTTYYYRVRAGNAGGISGNSNKISVVTLDNPGPVITIKSQPSGPQIVPGPYLVQAVITDPAKKGGKSIAADSLYYRVNSGSWAAVGFEAVAGDTFDFNIPAIDTGTIEYYLQAWDDVDSTTIEPPASYYSFFVDTIPPTVVWTSPADGATNVLLNAPVIIAFSEPMDTLSVDGYPSPNHNLTLSWNATGDTLTLTPDTLYEYNTAYSVIATSGRDTLGNNIAVLPDTLVTFTTINNQGPEITVKTQPSSPQTVAGPYLVQAVITDPAKKGSKNIATDSLYYRVNGAFWTGIGYDAVIGDTFDFYIPAIDTGNIEYYLQAWDDVGAATVEPTATYYSFYVDTIHPSVVWTSPADGDSNVALNTPLVIVFSEPMDTASVVFYTSPDAGIMTILWSTTFDTLTLTPTIDYGYDLNYALILTAGTDLLGNDLTVLPDTVLNFITIPSGVEGKPESAGYGFYLSPVSPNPVQEQAEFRFGLDKSCRVSLEIFNVLGQHVQTLLSGTVPAGNHSAKWNGRDDNGRKVSSGVYIYRLVAGEKTATRRFTVVK